MIFNYVFINIPIDVIWQLLRNILRQKTYDFSLNTLFLYLICLFVPHKPKEELLLLLFHKTREKWATQTSIKYFYIKSRLNVQKYLGISNIYFLATVKQIQLYNPQAIGVGSSLTRTPDAATVKQSFAICVFIQRRATFYRCNCPGIIGVCYMNSNLLIRQRLALRSL